MKQLDIKYIAASNFMCFGPDGIELELDKMGRIVHVKGEHVDIMEEDGKPSGNGVGKSTITDIVSFVLTGKTVKPHLTQDSIINNREKKKLYGEIRFDDYRVVRTVKPNSLRIWKSADGNWTDDTEISRGGIPATQKYLSEILGLSHQSLVNLIFFTDDNRGCFLECVKSEKREIVENMLGLEKYREYCENAKKRKKMLIANTKVLAREYEQSLAEVTRAEDRLKQAKQGEAAWIKTKEQELQGILAKLQQKKAALESSDAGLALAKYNEAQAEIAAINEDLEVLAAALANNQEILNTARGKLGPAEEAKRKLADEVHAIQRSIQDAQAIIDKNNTLVDGLKAKKVGTQCPHCLGTVDAKNFKTLMTKAENEIEAAKATIKHQDVPLERLVKELQGVNKTIATLSGGIQGIEVKQTEGKRQEVIHRRRLAECLAVKEPKVGSDELLLESQIEELKKQAVAKKEEAEGPSPFAGLIDTSKADLDSKQIESGSKKAALTRAEGDLPYFDYFLKAFGDNGIRKYIIRDILPSLNSRIAYWLQYLIDNKITLKFDEELEETIERNPADGDPFVYYALSRGQQRRLNLAVQQAFAHVMAMTCGTSPSFIFLDEVSTNIDPAGIQCVYNMITELAKDKQVFVTTHDRDMQGLLDGCDTVHLQMRNGITNLLKK